MSNIFSNTDENEWTNTTNHEWGLTELDPDWLTFKEKYGAQCKILYYCTLTGDAEDPVVSDIEIPISSFQARLRYDQPTYLAVVIPDIDTYSALVTARSNGDLSVDMAWVLNGVEEYRETIVTVDLESIATDEGARNQSINLSGHRTVAYTNHFVELDSVTYKALQADGKLRFRTSPPDLYLRAGDIAWYGSDEIEVVNISNTVSVDAQTMEVTER